MSFYSFSLFLCVPLLFGFSSCWIPSPPAHDCSELACNPTCTDLLESSGKPSKVDIVFLINPSPSLLDVQSLDTVLRGFAQDLLQSGMRARWSVVLFRGWTELVLNWTSNVEHVAILLERISQPGGCLEGLEDDPPWCTAHGCSESEPLLEAIRIILGTGCVNCFLDLTYVGGGESYTGLGFRPDARKLINIITDEDSDLPWWPENRVGGQMAKATTYAGCCDLSNPNATIRINCTGMNQTCCNRNLVNVALIEPPIRTGHSEDYNAPDMDDWVLETMNTAQAIIENDAWVNIVMGESGISHPQLGYPAAMDYNASVFGSYDPCKTLENLLKEPLGTGIFTLNNSLMTQVLLRSQCTIHFKAFHYLDVRDGFFFQNLFRGTTHEMSQCQDPCNQFFPCLDSSGCQEPIPIQCAQTHSSNMTSISQPTLSQAQTTASTSGDSVISSSFQETRSALTTVGTDSASTGSSLTYTPSTTRTDASLTPTSSTLPTITSFTSPTSTVTLLTVNSTPLGGDSRLFFMIFVAALIAFGCLSIAVFLGFFLFVKKARPQNETASNQDISLQSPSLDPEHPVQDKDDNLLMVESCVNIPFLELELGETLGEGNFGLVRRGVYEGNDCVVKTLKFANEGTRAELLREIAQLNKLTPHASICTFYGACVDPKQPLAIVLEFINGRNLSDLMHTTFARIDLLSLFKDLAGGMSHLHKNLIVHADLAARNCLVVGQNPYRLKVTDFGLSKVMPSEIEPLSISNQPIPVRWSAPEIFDQQHFFLASDVWSFGVVLWECLAKSLPYYEMSSNAQVIEHVLSGGRLPCPHEDLGFSDLMLECWASNPKDRPTFKELIRRFSLWYRKEHVSSTHHSLTIANPQTAYQAKYPINDFYSIQE